jgi:hypothetical protein
MSGRGGERPQGCSRWQVRRLEGGRWYATGQGPTRNWERSSCGTPLIGVGLLDRFRRQRISVTKVPGGLIVGDLEAFGTEQRPPMQADLDTLIAYATRVAIREPTTGRKKPLFETSDTAELASLRDALRIHDGGIGHCMCFGSLAPEFRRGACERAQQEGPPLFSVNSLGCTVGVARPKGGRSWQRLRSRSSPTRLS